MNHIEQAYEQGKRIRVKYWVNGSWIKKYSSNHSITEHGAIWWCKCWSFYINPEVWEIWHEDLPLLTQADIKAQIQTHLTQIQELLKQL